MTHELKIRPQYLNDICLGIKTFEVRKKDRNFKLYDKLLLREWINGEYTGMETLVTVVYILDDPEFCKDGYVILGIK